MTLCKIHVERNRWKHNHLRFREGTDTQIKVFYLALDSSIQNKQISPSQDVGYILAKDVVLRIMLNVDGTPITSHTHPSHTQNSHLLTSSLSLGIPGPLGTHLYVFSLALALPVVHNK